MTNNPDKLAELDRKRRELANQLAELEAESDAERQKVQQRESARKAILNQEASAAAERAKPERAKPDPVIQVSQVPPPVLPTSHQPVAAPSAPPVTSSPPVTSALPVTSAPRTIEPNHIAVQSPSSNAPPPQPGPPVPQPTPATMPAQTVGGADKEVDPEDEDDSDHDGGWDLRSQLRNAPPVLISTVFHALVLVILGLMTLAIPAREQRGIVMDSASAAEDDAPLEELSDVELTTEDMPEMSDISVPVMTPDPGMANFSDVTSAVSAVAATGGDLDLQPTTVGEIGELFGEQGKGMSDSGEGTMATASFFGSKSMGSRFVFVVDNSNSMGRGKFETVMEELVRSVDKLTPKQRFYVYFFSDQAYPLFHPNPPYGMVRATPENKQKLKAWLYNVEMCLRTQGREAMQAALKMRPDAIYILGDGAFTDSTAKMLTQPHDRFTVINTIGMQVNDAGRSQLTAIAKKNKGTFREAMPSPAARAMARANPIRKNNAYGPVWGLKLPKKR